MINTRIEKVLKHARFSWDDETKFFVITAGEQHVVLGKVEAFALKRFITRIAQRNWFRRKHAIQK